MRKIKFEYRLIAGYLIVGCLWIVFSDKLLSYFVKDPEFLTRIQTFKGWFYVIVTSILFYSLLKRHLIKIRNAEQKARDSDRLKTAFIQNISHEIRTPMNGIVGFTELLKEKNLPEIQKNQYLELVTLCSNQLLNIINEVLDISLIESGNLSVRERNVHLNDLLEKIYSSFKSQVKNGIEFSLEKGLPDYKSVILTDEVKIVHILNNLINNAIKFTDKGHIKFGYVLGSDELVFFTEDTGIGINANLLDKIFERFHKAEPDNTRLYEGVGLGLAICKGNIDLLNGKIWAESELNKGSEFFFTIPYKPGNETQVISPVKDEIKKGKFDLTILVAEDDEASSLYIKEIFRETGWEILYAVNGKEAVELCKKNKNISIVLMDIKMPLLNGYEAIKQIKQIRPDISVIAQTAYVVDNEREIALNAGFADYISKPFTKGDLIALITKYAH